MSAISIEVVYRGVRQQLLAKRISRGVVQGARKEGKLGFTFGRYGDSPERVGIPAKQFAVIGSSEEELQPFMTPYELDNNDVTVVLDDTLCKGAESWAWHDFRPINLRTKPGGTLLVLSEMSPDELLKLIAQKGVEYNLAVIGGSTNWSTLWKYDDDNDARILGAIARVAPNLISLASAEQVITQDWKQAAKTDLAGRAFDEVVLRQVKADEGVKRALPERIFPKWQEMKEGLVVPAVPASETTTKGPYRAGRNPNYRTLSARTNRPVIDFARCRKCSLCWLQCPDGAFDVMSDGLYDINLEYCNGCGICASVCPVYNCISMVPEQYFTDNACQYDMWQEDNKSYSEWLREKTSKKISG